MVDLGKKLLRILKQQRITFTRDADGKKIISDPILFYALERESYFTQLRIGAENRRLLSERGIIVNKHNLK